MIQKKRLSKRGTKEYETFQKQKLREVYAVGVKQQNMKFELDRNISMEWGGGETLYRIRSLKDFTLINNKKIKKGDLGGWVNSEERLSQEGNCWIYDECKMFGKSYRCDESIGYGDSQQYGHSRQYGYSRQFGDSQQYDHSRQYGHSLQYGYSRQFGDSCQYGYSRQFGDSCQYGYSRQYGHSLQYGYSRVGEKQYLSAGRLTCDITNGKNMAESLSCQLDIAALPDNTVILYKKVNKVSDGLFETSYKQSDFTYITGEYAKEPEYNSNPTVSCGRGLHASTANYWQDGDTLIAVKIDLDDIIAIQEGKVRCKRLFVIGECKQIRQKKKSLVSLIE